MYAIKSSAPPGKAAPNCLVTRLIAIRGRRCCRIAPKVMIFMHVMPTPTGKHFLSKR